jgi:hypothetical protein
MRNFMKACKRLHQRMKKAIAKILCRTKRSTRNQPNFETLKKTSALDMPPTLSTVLSDVDANPNAAFDSIQVDYEAKEESLLSDDSHSLIIGCFSIDGNSSKS